MTTEFNLSEKERIGYFKEKGFGGEFKVILSQDVKEFIRLLKEEIKKGCMGTSANCYLIKKEIDKLAGDKLKTKEE